MAQWFTIQKNLLNEAIALAAANLKKSNNPDDSAQYLNLSTMDDKLEISFCTEEFGTKVVLDKANDFLKIHCKQNCLIQGSTVLEVLNKAVVLDDIEVTFENATGVVPNQDPSAPQIPQVGIIKFTWAANIGGQEEWEFPCVGIKIPSIVYEGDGIVLDVLTKEFSKSLKQIGSAVGRDTGDARYKNIVLKTNKDGYEMVSASETVMAISKQKHISCSGDFSATILYAHLNVIKSFDEESSLSIKYLSSDSPNNSGRIVMTQNMMYGDKNVGTLLAKISCQPIPFVKYEKVLKAFSSGRSCKVMLQQLQQTTNKLLILKGKVTFKFDVNRNAIVASQEEAGKAKVKGLAIPASNMNGDDFECQVSNNHLNIMASATGDEAEFKFGDSSFCLVTEGVQFIAQYFAEE